MHKDIRLHGLLDNGIEYFVMVVGTEAYQRYFFNIVQDEDRLRIFSPGNEFILGPHGINYQGNGGYFCEYMFGVEQPNSDQIKPELVNRLVMFGAHVDESSGQVQFSEHTGGSQSYENLFFEGNAVCNYFFFVYSPKMSRKLKQQQEDLVKMLGKTIKRTQAVGEERDDLLVADLYPLLNDPLAQLYMVKLINRKHKEYQDLFRSFYFRSKKISDEDYAKLLTIANIYQIDRYQQERMRIDVMYRHPMNRRIVDEYRSILIGCNAKGEISPLDNARLTRLKTLSVRSKIPGALLFTLDELLKKGRDLEVVHDEEDYISQTRQILEGFFLCEQNIDSSIDREDMLALIRAKKWAAENRDHHFDHLMLEFSKQCDERIRDGADPAILEGFSYVITYLDRFDSSTSLIGQLAFMENVKVSEEMLQGLMEHKAAFDNLQEGGFEEMFVNELYDNPYLGRFGRQKINILMAGIKLMQDDKLEVSQLHRQLTQIDDEERLYLVLLEQVRHRVRNFYSRFTTKADQDALRRDVVEELRARKRIKGDVPDHVFQEVMVTMQKEAMYIQSILPVIVAEKNSVMREDFLENSGLDRFYVEELEREYFENNGLEFEGIYQIRQGGAG